jgi:hypothetical protein
VWVQGAAAATSTFLLVILFLETLVLVLITFLYLKISCYEILTTSLIILSNINLNSRLLARDVLTDNHWTIRQAL